MQNSHKLTSLIPLNAIEPEALEQLQKALNHDFVKKIAVMPDIHAGYDLPIGSVALTDSIISPSFVGYDIGCGMCQVKLPDKENIIICDEREAVSIHNRIKAVVPSGFSSHGAYREYINFTSASEDKKFSSSVNLKIQSQLGTLGGGNHFIEIGKNKEGDVFITIHSGSRNAGHQVAERYMKIGKYLKLDSEAGKAYERDMLFMLDYALANRLDMVKSIVTGVLSYSDQQWKKQILPTLINENHNHAEVRADGVLHRKGATPAAKDQLGVIPGNMRDGVYITRGIGDEKYLNSSSHGAGRVMSRKNAKSLISLEEFKNAMKGIAADVSGHTLDEAPFAYKDLDEVIRMQNHIVVDLVDHVKPLINIKG
ncbi:MAG: RtcB family protein [Spirochaetia bacterium]|nr:RtcB family protein [Spirochaetia bacterium]